MNPLFGEYACKVDPKGRFLLPAALLKQLNDADQHDFVINRGLDPCLVLYPLRIWKEELSKIFAKNQYTAKNRAFARRFQAGATPLTLDGQKRVLVPKRLAEWAEIDKSIVLIGAFDRIEIWSEARYEAWLNDASNDLEALSEDVMADPDA